MLNYKFLVLGFVVAAVLLVPTMTTDVFADYAFVKSLEEGPHSISCGGVPSGTCMIQSPYGLSTDNVGNVYATSYYGNYVVKFDSFGNYHFHISVPAKPYGVGVDSMGNIYVASTSTNKISKYDSSGSFLLDFSLGGKPYQIGIDSSNNIYVALPDQNLIQKFDSSGSFLLDFGSSDLFNKPHGVSIDSSGIVYVADRDNYKIQKFDSSGSFIGEITGVGSGTYGGPITIAIDPTGNIFTTTHNGFILSIFDSSGNLLNEIGGSGGGSNGYSGDPLENCKQTHGYFNSCSPIYPSAVAVDTSGRIYVAETNNARIIELAQLSGPFTVDYFEIFEESGHTRFKVGGDMPEPHSQRNMSYLITDSNGNVTYEYLSTTTAQGDGYGLDAPVFYTSTSWNSAGQGTGGDYTQEYDGDFTLKICAPEIDQCMEKEFTISNDSAATGPFTITDDSTGGDCTSIGTWSSSTKTCTLTGNITVGQVHAIVVGSDGITIDGAGHSISGGVLDESCPYDGTETCSTMTPWNGNAGVYMFNKDHVVIKNLIINGFFHGILTDQTSSYGIITGNTISSPGQHPHGSAIDIKGGNYVQITNNEISNSYKGIKVFNVRGSDQCSGDNSFVISQNTINMPSGSYFGISNTYNSINEHGKGVCIDQNTITGGDIGITIGHSKGGITTDNTVTGAGIGFFISYDNHLSTMTGNTANSNTNKGFWFDECQGVLPCTPSTSSFSSSSIETFTGNTATGNGVDFVGISQESSSGIVNVDSLTIGQSGTKNGVDCDSVGTWVPTDTGPEGGTCTLSTDIQITGLSYGIKLASSKVTLDGAGHSITGNALDNNAGTRYAGVWIGDRVHTIVIKDLTIDTFAYGIYGYYSNGLTITGVTIQNIGKIGINLDMVDSLLIENNVLTRHNDIRWTAAMMLSGHEHVGIGNGSCIGTGEYVSSSITENAPMVIKNNQITNGIVQIGTATDWCVDGNTITKGSLVFGPSHLGILPTNHIIKNNQVTDSIGYDGFQIYGSGNTIDSNIVNENSNGFRFESSSRNNIISNNIVNNNFGYGLTFMEGSYGHTFTDNTITGNRDGDIHGLNTAPAGPFNLSANGGDCLEIGTWNQGLKTCTMNTDIFGSPTVTQVNIVDSDVTLDGNGHKIYSTYQAPSGTTAECHGVNSCSGGFLNTVSGNLYSGVMVHENANGVTVKNLTVIGFGTGVLLSGYDGTLKNTVLFANFNGFTTSSSAGNNIITENTIEASYNYSFDLGGSNNKIYNNNFLGDYKKGWTTNNNNILNLDAPYGGNYYENVGFSIPSSSGETYSSNDCQENWVEGAFCPSAAMGFGAGVQSVMDNRPWIEKNGWVGYTPPLPDTCFPSMGYSIMQPNTGNAYQDPPGSFNMVPVIEQTGSFSGKIQSDEDGTCSLSNSLGLAGKSVTFTATKGDLIKNAIIFGYDNQPISSSIDDDGYGGFFNFLVPFTDVGDGGTWSFTYSFSGDDQYAATSKTATINIPEPAQKIDTCFPSSGYSAPWNSDPDTPSRDVQISGKLSPKQYGQCILLNELFLKEQSVVITATKNEVTKTATVTTDNDGFFNSVFSFTDDSDEGPWAIAYSFDGDEKYYSNTELGNGDPNYVLNIPAPPPNPKPIVNVPNDITLYTGTPSFSFAQSTINYNLYSGNSGPVFYPQPTASITGVSSEVVTFDVTATDNDLSSGPTCNVTSGSEFSVGTTTVTCTATDSDGGVGTASFDVTVIEQTIGGSGQVSCTPGSNSQFPIGSTPVSCSVTDGQGNTSSDTFAVNVQPKSPLSDSQCRAKAGSGHDSGSVFVCEYPFHVTVEEGQRLVWVDTQPWQGFYHHSLTSNNYLFDHTDAGVMDMLPSAWGGVGVYSFYDKLNTVLSGSITIAESDTTAPNVNVPNDLVISTEDQNGTPIVTYFVSATDDREVVSGPTCNVASGSTFSIGTTEVTCTASDAAGNIGTDSFDVTVEYTYIDTTPPGFAAYDDISKATTNPAGTVVSYTLPTVTDNIGVTSGPTCDLPSGSVFPIGTTEVKCDASDAAGNPASILFNVVMTKTYVDDTAPAVYITFGETSDEIAVAADSSSGKELGFTVNAIDNVGVTVGPICSGDGVSLGLTPIGGQPGFYTIDSKMYPIGVSFVVCTAYDAIGNSGSSIFAVTIQPEVVDTPPLVISTAMGIAGLDFPMSVAVDDSGNIYVADVGSDTIKKFDSYHNLIFTISNLNNPFDVAVDSSSNIYVAEQGSGCIKKYNSNGSFIGGIGCFSSTLHSMSIKNDQIYLTTNPYESSGDVVKMSLTGNSVNTFAQMSGPNGIAVDDLGNVYVVKSNDGSGSNWNPEGVIVKYDSSGNMISTIGDGYTSPISNPPNGQSLEQNLGKFTSGYGIEVDSSGKIYHADHHNKRVTIFDSSGNVLKWITTMPVSDIGGTPSDDISFGRINDVTVDSVGNIYIADGMDNGRIVILPSIATMPEMFANPNQVICNFNDPYYSTTCGDTTPPRGAVTQPITIDVGGKAVYLDADDDGNFVVGLEGNVIKKYDVNNNLVISFSDNWLNGVGFDSSGNIIVANGDYKIKKYDSDGQFLQDIANLPSRPFRMEVDSNDNVFVTSDAGNYVEKIYKVTPLGAVSTVYTESSDPNLVGIGVDTSGNLYVGQNFKDGQYNKCCKIMKYSPSGSLITSMGGWWGNNPPALAGLTGSIQDVAIHPLTGNVYAADEGNDRISVFTPSGTFVKQIGSVGVLLNDPYGVDFDSFGNLYVTQRTDSNQVMIFPPNYSDPASNDSIPPTITQIQNIERYTSYSSGSTVSWNLASQDNELVASQECNHTSGSNFPVGTTTVTCTAIDNAGNKSTMSFDITQILSEITSNTITSDKDSYIFGIDQKVILTGTVLNMDSGFVWVESYSPNGGGGHQVEVYGGHFFTHVWVPNDYYEQHNVKLRTVGSCYPNCTVLDTISFTVTQPSEDEINNNVDLLNTRFIQTVNESGLSQECVDTGCYTPSNITVNVGDIVNMTNTDSTFVHTFVSGTVDGFAPSPDGTFDSGILESGDSIEWIPQTEGVVPYYCMLHTWMTGTIFVGDSDPLTSTLNQNFYTTGDTMILSGYSNSTNSITHQLFTEGNLVEIAQLDVGPDGSFSHTMITEGPLWNPGDYLSKVTDSQDNIIEKQFSFTVTFGEFTKFAKSQEFSNSMAFEKYQHFEDSTDFTAISQTFKEGTTFGDGTTFRSDGTQSLPVGTIPSFGVMLEEFSCVTADCKPTDTSKFLSPGDFLPSGIDPAASFSKITSADKSFTIDGLGLTMTFDTVYGDGTIKADLYDPANIPSSTDAGSGKVSVVTNTSESISTIGSVIDLSVDTATVSGSITITMPYLESNVPAGTAESDLVVLHYTNNQWVTESNCIVDTLNNKITCIVTELSPFGIGSRSVTQTSEDENLDVDITPPEFEEVNNILVDATTSNGATVTYEIPKATDDGGITDTPICEPESGSFFSIGTTPVTCTVKDIAGIQGATTFLVTVKSLIAAPVEIPSNVSIKIGKSDYNTKEAIFVSGIATPFTEDKVSINVQDQSDNMVLVEQITPESSGIYTGIIFPNSLWSTSGNYTMSATYGTATDSVPFTFEYIQTEIDNSNIPTGITLNTNATGYALGDMISVTSQLTGGTSGQSIIIDVKDESGDNVVINSLNTDDSGSISLSFKAQDNWIPGTYNVTASDGSPLWDYSTSELIQLVRPLPKITISPTVTTTESGDVITSYKAGEIGYFSTALLSESTSNVLVTINVVDSEDATLGVAFFKSIIGKGDSEIVLGFKIPDDAADGVAKIYVNTYTDWIDQGGIVISSELLSEVNIEGVISVENISEDGTVLVIPKLGSSVPGCEQSIQGCYLPNPTIINVGDTISFSNTDTEPHTFTSGSPSNGPNGIFDSSVLMSGEKYEFTFEDEGKYDYFDMIRPWMAGTIVVGNSESYTTLPENIIPKFSDIPDIVQSASSSVGNTISYQLPIAIGGVITSGTTCTPAPGSMFPIGSTQVTCTATNDFGNTGMTSFMVTINPILQTADQSLSVKVGKDLYNNLEPLFVTGSVGKITGDSINLEVYDELNHLISIEQTTPKESGVYNTIITSNKLWGTTGEYTIIAKYDSASAQDTFEFELIEVEKIISEKIPTSLFIDTLDSAYVLGDNVFIEMQLVDAGAGESILLEVRDSQNDQVLLQSLNTDSDGNADISYQLESTHDSGIYSVIATSANWDFITTDTFVAVAQIPDIIVGDVVSTLQDGTEVDSFAVGDIGYFQTPIISNSTSNVLITVNIFDVENTPLGLAYFNSKVVDDTFDIVLGLQIPENVMPGLATVYINTYTDWPNEGGVPILEEQVSFIEISPSSISDLTLSPNSVLTSSTEVSP